MNITAMRQQIREDEYEAIRSQQQKQLEEAEAQLEMLREQRANYEQLYTRLENGPELEPADLERAIAKVLYAIEDAVIEFDRAIIELEADAASAAGDLSSPIVLDEDPPWP